MTTRKDALANTHTHTLCILFSINNTFYLFMFLSYGVQENCVSKHTTTTTECSIHYFIIVDVALCKIVHLQNCVYSNERARRLDYQIIVVVIAAVEFCFSLSFCCCFVSCFVSIDSINFCCIYSIYCIHALNESSKQTIIFNCK